MDIDKIKLTTQEILMFVTDVSIGGLFIFDKHGIYRRPILDYFEQRSIDRGDFYKKLYKLKKSRLIKIYQKNKQKYIELTPKGKLKLSSRTLRDLMIDTSQPWDKKWRIIIFDIPEDKKDKREAFRRKLEALGFYQFQKSVFVFPYECRKEIDLISRNFFIEQYVKYIVADFFQDDSLFIDKFLKEGILNFNK